MGEIALWMPWLHCGRMTAASNSHIVTLDATGFLDLISECDTQGAKYIRTYATLFLNQYFDELSSGSATDIGINFADVKKMTEKTAGQNNVTEQRNSFRSERPSLFL